MKSRLINILLIVLVSISLIYCQVKPKPKSRRVKKPVDTICPDTCTLKRRIGKLQLNFEGDVTEVKEACLSEIKSLRSEVFSRNFTIPNVTSITKTRTVQNASQPSFDVRNLTNHLTQRIEKQVALSVSGIKSEFAIKEQQLNEAFETMRELAASMNPTTNEEEIRENREREIDFRRTIDYMNRTLQELQLQNANLQRQTQVIRSQSAVLRAQNEVLSDDNQDLRKQSQTNDLSPKDEQRIEEVEDSLSRQVASMSALEQQLEWLSERVSTLADSIDSASVEASSASKTAQRAEEIARKALNAVRGGGGGSTEEVSSESDPTEFPQPDTPPTDCWELYQMGYNKSGVYSIRPWQSGQVFEVFCEQSYDGGGWTMIQKRRDGSVDFDRDWVDYAEGFGDLKGEMWLGNDKIHAITNQDTYRLQVILLDWDGSRAYAEYEGFRVHSSVDYYSLRFGTFSRGSAGDGFRGLIDDGSRNLYLARFTTSDMDNDSCRPCLNGEGQPFENCADLQGGGWWFRACSDSNLNGRYIHQQDIEKCGESCNGIQWRTWKSNARYSLKASIMMVKPVPRQ